jgi:hypothetical protein
MLKTAQAAIGFFLAAFLIPAGPAAAQEGCAGFGFPLDTELAWMTAPDAETIETGAKIPALPAKAVSLKLKLSKDVTLPVKSGQKKQAVPPESYSGWFEITSLPKAGVYQISLSLHGWIDAAQNGELVQSRAFTGSPGCKTLRKSVRYEFGTGPLTVEVVGVPADTLKVTVREAN